MTGLFHFAGLAGFDLEVEYLCLEAHYPFQIGYINRSPAHSAIWEFGVSGLSGPFMGQILPYGPALVRGNLAVRALASHLQAAHRK